MCRRNHLQGWCLACLGIGMMLGHNVESWLICCCTGVILIVLGLCLRRQK